MIYLGSLAHEDEFCGSTTEVLALAGHFLLHVVFIINFYAVGTILSLLLCYTSDTSLYAATFTFDL